MKVFGFLFWGIIPAVVSAQPAWHRCVVEVRPDRAVAPFNPNARPDAAGLEGVSGRLLAPRLWFVAANESRRRDLLEDDDVTYVGNVYRDSGGSVWYVLPEVFVKLKEGLSPDLLLREAEEYGIEFLGAEEDVLVFQFSKQSRTTPEAWSFKLQSIPDVVFAEPNLGFHPIVATNDPYFPYQWALKNTGSAQQGWGTAGADIDAEAAWSITTGSPQIKIAILDSGVDTLHPDLMPNLLPGYDATGGGSQGYPNVGPFPSDGHGTACAGIAAAAGNNGVGVAGVAYSSKIIPVKMFYYIDTTIVIPGLIDTTLQEIPFSTTQYMVQAINWARNTGQADVMSNSWGIPPNLLPFAPVNQNTVSNAIQNAATLGRGGKGISMFFSSGNDNDILIWPASLHAYAISVGATTNKDKRASYSNYGFNLDFTAPGHLLYTTDFTGGGGYSNGDYFSQFAGTSAACPVAAGIAALVLSVRPDFTADQVRRCLRQSAEKTGGYAYDSLGLDGPWNQEMGYGRLNAHQALLLAPQLGLDESDSAPHFTVFPNPSSGTFFVKLPPGTEPQAAVEIYIYRLDGQGLLNFYGLVQGSSLFSCVWPAHIPAGMYFCRIRVGQKESIHKIVLRRS
ncbi:MAG: S8 family peptidase [Flavobacteriales bacterium]|nr:S8 family peptidase [Flavobacteriales bacterium]